MPRVAGCFCRRVLTRSIRHMLKLRTSCAVSTQSTTHLQIVIAMAVSVECVSRLTTQTIKAAPASATSLQRVRRSTHQNHAAGKGGKAAHINTPQNPAVRKGGKAAHINTPQNPAVLGRVAKRPTST